LDLRYVFDEYQETIFNDQIHVGVVGHKIITDNIFESAFPLVQNSLK